MDFETMSDGADKLGDFPPEIDLGYYRRNNPNLAELDDAAALAHFEIHGKDKGRKISSDADREGFLEHVVAPYPGDLLEIGPFCHPLVRGPRVSYLDVLDSEALRARAVAIGMDPDGCPEHIDYVGPIDRINRTFAGVVSCHAIEHQPDLVRHLQAVARFFEPEGCYFLVIPDHRNCLDAQIAPSTITGVMQAYREHRTRHTLRSVIEHRALTVHNNSSRHWLGQIPELSADDQARRTKAALEEFARAGESYLDVHAWYFTPRTFRTIIDVLSILGLIGLSAVRVYYTVCNRNEFCAVLQRTASSQL